VLADRQLPWPTEVDQVAVASRTYRISAVPAFVVMGDHDEDLR
jgi:hypothetical protein